MLGGHDENSPSNACYVGHIADRECFVHPTGLWQIQLLPVRLARAQWFHQPAKEEVFAYLPLLMWCCGETDCFLRFFPRRSQGFS